MKIYLTLIIGALLCACGPVQTDSGSTGIKPPKWYMKRAQVSAICGFGTVEFNGDYGLAEQSAIDFARDELGKNVKTRVQSYLEAARKAARQNVNGTGKSASSSAQEQFMRNVNDNTVRFATPRNAEMVNNTFFAMVCLDSSRFLKELQKNREVQAGMEADEVIRRGTEQIRSQGEKLDRFLQQNASE